MIRRIAVSLTLFALLLTSLAWFRPAAAAPVRALPFTLVHIADVHIGAPRSREEAARVFAAVRGAQPAFVVDGGDSTEMGRPSEYETYRQLAAGAGVPFHVVPGNHDARWFDAGKREFVRRHGEPYRSFDYGLVHFVLLDTSVDAETHGHFEESMLRWLRDDLARTGPHVPVFIFFHHPIGFRPLNFIDNEQAFYDVIEPYNVRGIFTGHGHLHYQWQVNNIPHFMTQAALEGGWRRIDVRPESFETIEGTFSLSRAASPGRLHVERAEVADRQLLVRVRAEQIPADAVVFMRSGGAWQALERGAGGIWTGALWVDRLPTGIHDLQLYATAEPNLPGQPATPDQWTRRDLGAAWTARVGFELGAPGTGASAGGVGPGAPTGPAVLWRYQAEGSIQGPPAVYDGLVVFTARDGTVTALEKLTGSRLWTAQLGRSPVSAGVTAAAGSLFTGNTEGALFALDPATGGARWQQRLGGALLGEPAYGGGMLFTGAADGHLYGLHALTGEILWRANVGGAVRAQPTYAHGTVYTGAWNGEVLAFNAFTGRELWRTRLTANPYLSPANVPLTYYRGRILATNSVGGALTTGLWALDARTGRILWQSAEPAGYSSPFLRQAELVGNTPSGRIFGINPMTGERTWAQNLGKSIFDSYAVPFGGAVLTGGLYGRVTAAAPDGVRWRFDVGDTYVFARMATDGDRVYVGTMDGWLYAIRAPLEPEPPLPAFPDTAAHWAAAPVGAARRHGFVSGYADGLFRPDGQVTRAEMASMLARWLGLTGFAQAQPFADMEEHWAAGAVAQLAELGIVSGRTGPDGLQFFRPDLPVTRAEAAAMLARTLGRTAPTSDWESRLGDLAGHWSRFAVEALEELGLVSGYREGAVYRFRPDGTLTRAEAATLLMRAALPER